MFYYKGLHILLDAIKGRGRGPTGGGGGGGRGGLLAAIQARGGG